MSKKSVSSYCTLHCTEVHFVSLLSGGFTTMAVINPPEKKLAKRTSVDWSTAQDFTDTYLTVTQKCIFNVFIYTTKMVKYAHMIYTTKEDIFYLQRNF